MTEEVIELHGHKSASQRREYALQVEAMRMKILADHLRAVLILLIRRTGQPQTFLKADIKATLGMKLESVDTEDKLGVVFSADWPDHPEDIPGPRKLTLQEKFSMPDKEAVEKVESGLLCIHLYPTDGSKGNCPHCT